MGPSQGYHLPLVADLLPSPPLTLSKEVTPNGCVALGSPLPAPSLTVLTSKPGGDDMPHGTAREEEDKCRARLTGSLLAPGGRGPVVPPCPSQHHTPHWFPSPGQDNTGWHSTSWAGPKGLTGTHGPRGCQPSFESKGPPALVAMNLQAASPRPKRRPPHLGCPFIAGHDQVVAFLTWANTRHP